MTSEAGGRSHAPSSAPAMSLARYDANVLLAAVTALSAAVAFVAALHLYARCLLQRRAALAAGGGGHHALVLRRPPDGYVVEIVSVAGAGADAACGQDAGLDATALHALPVFAWESKEAGGAAAEMCAVCLGEMEDGELGRLLPACRHVFHVACIDAWLGVSSACPVCRTAAAAAATATAAPAGVVGHGEVLEPTAAEC